jgi:hypothetical protein
MCRVSSVDSLFAAERLARQEATNPDAKVVSQFASIQSARAGARQGDIFTPEMTAFVKRLLNRVFGGPKGWQLRSSIMDENVKFLPVKVNQRYPDTIPLTSMPPEVLKALPELPEEMEYRFVGDQLILLDPHAHLIPDFIPNATDYAFLVAEIIDDHLYFNTISRAGHIVDSGMIVRRLNE